MAVEDAAYEEIDGDDDEFLDLGVSLGKMRINERLGGFFRPRISQEVSTLLSNCPVLSSCLSACLPAPACFYVRMTTGKQALLSQLQIVFNVTAYRYYVQRIMLKECWQAWFCIGCYRVMCLSAR